MKHSAPHLMRLVPLLNPQLTRPAGKLALLLEGYCLEPVQWSHSLLPQTWAAATWSDQPGYFDRSDPLHPPYGREGLGALVEARAGTKMMGWF